MRLMRLGYILYTATFRKSTKSLNLYLRNVQETRSNSNRVSRQILNEMIDISYRCVTFTNNFVIDPKGTRHKVSEI